MNARLIHRPRPNDSQGRARGRKSFTRTDYRDLIVAAHNQLDGPIVLARDNLNTHLAANMKELIAAQDRLTVHQLPPYAPDLNPVEGIWSLLRRGFLSDVAFADPDHLLRTVRRGLRKIQYRPQLIDGCLANQKPSGTCTALPWPDRGGPSAGSPAPASARSVPPGSPGADARY